MTYVARGERSSWTTTAWSATRAWRTSTCIAPRARAARSSSRGTRIRRSSWPTATSRHGIGGNELLRRVAAHPELRRRLPRHAGSRGAVLGGAARGRIAAVDGGRDRPGARPESTALSSRTRTAGSAVQDFEEELDRMLEFARTRPAFVLLPGGADAATRDGACDVRRAGPPAACAEVQRNGRRSATGRSLPGRRTRPGHGMAVMSPR